MTQEMHDRLRHAQALLPHQLPSGDVTEVLERALGALIARLEKAKFAATERPRAVATRTSANPRHIPAHVKRAVRERDGCQCTFVSEAGQRCPARTFLEFDHIDAVARGGKATVDRMRLNVGRTISTKRSGSSGSCSCSASSISPQQRDARRRDRADSRIAWT